MKAWRHLAGVVKASNSDINEPGNVICTEIDLCATAGTKAAAATRRGFIHRWQAAQKLHLRFVIHGPGNRRSRIGAATHGAMAERCQHGPSRDAVSNGGALATTFQKFILHWQPPALFKTCRRADPQKIATVRCALWLRQRMRKCPPLPSLAPPCGSSQSWHAPGCRLWSRAAHRASPVAAR